MGGLFKMDTPVMIFLSKATELLIANFLWVICSMPVITIGASTTALYYVCFKILNNEEISVIKIFFYQFKDNLKQATGIFIILFLALGFFGYGIYWAIKIEIFEDTVGLIIMGILIILALVIISMFIYAIALQSYFENTMVNTIINAFYFSCSYFGYNIVMIIIDLVVLVLGLRFCPFLLPVVPIMINTMFFKKIFVKYVPKEDKAFEEM